jgi:hypothetical protein
MMMGFSLFKIPQVCHDVTITAEWRWRRNLDAYRGKALDNCKYNVDGTIVVISPHVVGGK